MKSRSLIAALALIFSMLACNLPSSSSVTETPTVTTLPPSATQPLPTETLTQTPSPTDTPLPTLTFTPTVPIASARDVNVNCRLGPGQAWVVLSGLNIGQASQIVGKNSDASWWYIVDPFNSSRNCWVSASVTNTGGNLAGIPVVETPKASVTKVNVKLDPNTINLGLLCLGIITPIEVTGTIEMNGPGTVKWHFETQQGGALPTQTTEFDAFGSKEFSVDHLPSPPAGEYWVRLIVTSPNDMQAEKKYKVECS